MKTAKLVILLLVGVMVSLITNAQEQIEVPSTIKDVTVFLRGAQINRESKFTIKQGTYDYVFTDLSASIDANTIQAKGNGNFTILSINHQLNYLKQSVKTKRVIQMEDSLALLTKRINKLSAQQTVYNEEQSMILSNKVIGGANNGVNPLDLEKAAVFFRNRLSEIKEKQLELQESIEKLNEEKSKIANQLNLEKSKSNGPVGEVVVGIASNSTQQGTIELNYIVVNAGWIPYYDLRSIDIKQPLELDYRALVYQSSGIDWENVNLTLSTADPTLRGNKPQLSPWYLYYYQAYSDYKKGNARASKAYAESGAPSVSSVVSDEEIELKEDALTLADFTTVQSKQNNLEYKIGIPTTVKSGGKQKSVHIRKNTLNADYKYYCVPKLDLAAYLVANVRGWADLELLPGNMNIFFEGTFIGKSYLDLSITSDTLPISMGQDKGIIVKREKIKDFESKSFIGLNKKENFGWKISVLNNKNAPIKMVIEDQMPLSSSNDINIEAIELSNAKLNKDYGHLEWEFDMNSKTSKDIILKYSVKYPKDKTIQY